jgi:hyperosmotically inducible protein
MKIVSIMKALGYVVAVTFALNAYAGDSSTTANPSAKGTSSSKASNRALARMIHRALARKKGVDPTHIYVKVINGAVTLTGSAVTQTEIDLATQATQGVDG